VKSDDAHDLMQRMAELSDELSESEDPSAATARELSLIVLEMHRRAFEQILAEDPLPRAHVLAQWSRDPLLEAIVTLHDLTPSQGNSPLIPAERLVRSAGATACELCNQPQAALHEHLYDHIDHVLLCVCDVCARASTNGRFARITSHATRLDDIRLSPDAWASLGLPVDLVYFVQRSAGPIAYFPSPAGSVEAPMPEAAVRWLTELCPDLLPDLEAVIVRRNGDVREAYRVSIDRALELVGELRRRWRGFGGGLSTEVDDVFRSLAGNGECRG
jgi:hypothetical protein